jgi:transketolase
MAAGFNENPEEKKSTRDGFGRALVEIGEKDENVWALTADVSESSRTHWFAEKFPERFVQVGVAEQNLASVAAGIASCGKSAFISAFGAFSPGRNFDQIRVSVCYSNLPVIIHASHTGLTVGPDGASHQMMEDIALMRSLPNMNVLAPSDFLQVKKATHALYEAKGPGFLRTSREKVPVFTDEDTPLSLGGSNTFIDGDDAAIFACGPLVPYALEAAKELKGEGVSCSVVDLYSIKPIDRKTIEEMAKKTGTLVSVEEHQVHGGMGSAVAEVLCSFKSDATLRIHGMYDKFGESGPAKELLKKYKLDTAGIKGVVLEEVRKNRG